MCACVRACVRACVCVRARACTHALIILNYCSYTLAEQAGKSVKEENDVRDRMRQYKWINCYNLIMCLS